VKALSIGAPVTSELRFNPIDSGAVAIRALNAIAKLRKTLDRRFVAFET
jgi:hypothetical protein